MKETLQDLKSRRSCRKYLPKQITEEELNAILEAGTYAPTGMGKQSPIMIAIQDKEIIEKLSKINAQIMGVTFDPFYSAPTVVLVLADASMKTHLEDGVLVIGNLLNAANALGIGSCYIYRAKETFEIPEGKDLLKQWGIEGDYKGIGFCILGYPDEDGIKPAIPRKSDYVIKIG